MIGRLNHVAIAVKDLEAACRTYRQVLGAEAAHALVRDLKTPLTRFEVRSPSLEDAYLKIVAATADDREESPLDDAPRRSFRR